MAKLFNNQFNSGATGLAGRIRNIELPGRAGIEYASARDANRHILSCAPSAYLDATQFDTVRFPPPDWAQEALAKCLLHTIAAKKFRSALSVVGLYSQHDRNQSCKSPAQII